MLLPQFYVDDIIKTALQEDINYLDTTTDLMIPATARSTARFMAKAEGVVCGLEVALRVFELLDPTFSYEIRLPEGSRVAYGDIIAELEGLKNGPITQEEVDDCRRGLLSSMDALGDSLAALENWYYGQITRGEPLYPPEYGKVLTSAVSLDEVRQTLQSYSYSVCYAVTAEPGTQGKGGSEDVE